MKILFISTIKKSPGGGGVFSQGVLNALKTVGCVEGFYCQDRSQRFWFVKAFFYAILGHVFFGLPLKVSFYFSPLLLFRFLKKNKDYDFVVFDHLETAWAINLGFVDEKHAVLVSHNDEAELLKMRLYSRARVFSAFLQKPLLQIFTKYFVEPLGRFQNNILKRVFGVLSISECFHGQVGGRLERILPAFSYRPYAGKLSSRVGADQKIRLGYIGNMNWWPNEEGLLLFIKNVLPRCASDVSLVVYGIGVDDFFKRHPEIKCSIAISGGFKEDLNDVWESCDVMIVPVFEGSGANVKFAEILYNGMPVLVSDFVYRQYASSVSAADGIYICSAWEDWLVSIAELRDRGWRAVPAVEREKFSIIYLSNLIIKFLG